MIHAKHAGQGRSDTDYLQRLMQAKQEIERFEGCLDVPFLAFFVAGCFFFATFWAALAFFAGDAVSSAALFLFAPPVPAALGAFTGDLHVAQL